jgi:sugar lactone lactonase YvrE
MALGGCLGGATPVTPPPAAHVARPEVQAGRRAPAVLFIADVDSNVLLYPANINQKNPPLSSEITQGVTRSVGVATDRRGTLYVVNSGGSRPSIAEYKRGATTPFKTIAAGLKTPGDDVVDSAGNLYVTDQGSNGGVVLVYAPGTNSPSRTISIPRQGRQGVGGLAFDPHGDLLVNSLDAESGVAIVYSVAPGSSTAQDLNLQGLPNGAALGVDGAGNIYAGGHAGEIAVYAPGKTNPTRSINANVDGFYTQLIALPNGTIYWPNYDTSQMFEFAPGASAPTNVFATQGSGVDAAVAP